jgi:hypothetical protein
MLPTFPMHFQVKIAQNWEEKKLDFSFSFRNRIKVVAHKEKLLVQVCEY